MRAQIEDAATGASASMVNIGQSTVPELAIATPPLAEQSALLTDLREHVATLESLSDSVVSAILLLQERRTAVISAAVTGQIDVRHLDLTD